MVSALQVVVAAILKRKLASPADPKMLNGGHRVPNDVVDSSTLPYTPRLRSYIELTISIFVSEIFNFNKKTLAVCYTFVLLHVFFFK